MDKNFWYTIGLIVVISNGFSILILFETLVFKRPYITLFIFIFFITYKINEGMFKKKAKTRNHFNAQPVISKEGVATEKSSEAP